MILKIWSVSALCCLLFLSSAQAQSSIQWLSWDDAMELSESQEKKFIVEIYTEWCAWCKRLDNSTLSQTEISDYINKIFYPIRLDGEYKDEIHFGDNTYKFVKSGRRGYHQLALEITQGNLSYPSIVFLDSHKNVIQSISGFYSPDDFQIMLEYIGGDHYKKTPWRSYYAQSVKQKATCVGNN